MKRGTLPQLLIAASLAIQPWSAVARTPGAQMAGAMAASKNAPRCRTSGKNKITIVCNYSPSLGSGSIGGADPPIALTRALLSFEPASESHMRVELTFKNAGSKRMDGLRAVYLAVDDASGQNHTRRVLPKVDFRKLAPGQSARFSEFLLIAAFQPGRYTVHLWIPDSDPALQFDSSKNLLLASEGVAEPATRLNMLATFTVAR